MRIENTSLSGMVGQKVIVRTENAGVFFGVLSEKNGKEVHLKDARRMWRWHAKKSISLSAVALYGLNENQSKIVAAVPLIWLEAIEIIALSKEAIISIEGAEGVMAQR